MKPTFKNHPKETGLRAVGNKSGAEIKFGGKPCGTILGASHMNGYRVQIAVKSPDDLPRIDWRWVMPWFETRDLKEAKEWVKANFDAIVAGRELHFFEEN